MKFLNALFLACVMVLVWSCDKDDDSDTLNGIIEIKFDETKTVDNLSYRFKDVSDSRCPSDVVCVWAGFAEVFLEISDIDLYFEESLCTVELELDGGICGTELEIGNSRVQLLSVDPYPVSTNPVDKEDYIIALQIDPL